MFVSVTTANTSDQPIQLASIVGDEMQGWLQDVDGYRGILILSKQGTTLGLTFWETEEVAERALPVRMEFLERIASVAGVEIQDVDSFEVTYESLGARLADSGG